jgi:hypothetical protein
MNIEFDMEGPEFEIMDSLSSWFDWEEMDEFGVLEKEMIENFILGNATIFAFKEQCIANKQSPTELKEKTDLFVLTLLDENYDEYSDSLEGILDGLQIKRGTNDTFHNREEEIFAALQQMTAQLNFDSLLFSEALDALESWSSEVDYINQNIVKKELSEEEMLEFVELYPISIAITQNISFEFAKQHNLNFGILATYNKNVDASTKQKFLKIHKLKNMFTTN